MLVRRIIYILEPFPVPFGGVATIYQHVELLSKNSLPAYVALRERPPIDYYGTTAPLLVGGNLQPERGDIFVIPEGFSVYVNALMRTPAKRLMFCQNQYNLPFAPTPRPGVGEFGVHGIIASIKAVQKFFADVYGLADLPLLPCAIDTQRFAAAKHKKRQIAFMPRKLVAEAHFIAATFKRRYPQHAWVPWVQIDKVTQAQAAQIMGESAVFLSLSHQESFGLPPLEAMACGCLVAGYHGDGGREYMTPQNGWWAETGDWLACIDGLAAAIEMFDRGKFEARRRAAKETVEQYSVSRLEAALIKYWQRELSEPLPEYWTLNR